MFNIRFGITALVFLFSVITNAQFQMGRDDLCFLNKDPDLAQFGFWGRLGAQEGVCQGMAGLSKIYKENVIFKPRNPKGANTLNKIKHLYNTYRSRPLNKVVINGYSGLNELCQDYRNTFLQQSIELNRSIAIQDILPIYADFNSLRDSPITSENQRHQLGNTVDRQIKILKKHIHPMILVYSHVMLVTDITYTGDGYLYTYYDSNYRDFRQWFVAYGPDQWPVLNQRMIWDITLVN